MDTNIISTFVLTTLMMIGLPFFIRASIKDRTEQIRLPTSQSEEVFLPKLQQYFESRAYRVVDLDREKNQVTFEGFVQPSLFLAIFLSCIAALGLLCVVLILCFFYPANSNLFWFLLLLAPTAGIFYWQKAGRLEKVLLSVEPNMDLSDHKSVIKLTGHRDELKQLQQKISFN
ncbi:conserved membrane hypothetical protein [Hyella patelloides LEGE 07179]|uniref:Cofactor assembly of complex C subunit B n=1 Tax=Hyella patelloides LEGE 07179 TaxID=945734 RepID=A0A563W243_9CYAN|nr:cofactor assembly of complex C subunit B [Hyella patelloides]VEP17748.1 conserved membrane hypothetical protein [Hyella patelloides LEGE 07179]